MGLLWKGYNKQKEWIKRRILKETKNLLNDIKSCKMTIGDFTGFKINYNPFI